MNTTDIDAILAPYGTSTEEILQYSPTVGAGETLLLVGSIAEGLANKRSDIDVLYLGNQPLKLKTQLQFEGAFDFSVAFNEKGTEINVDRIDLRSLDDMTTKIVAAIETLDNPRGGPPSVVRDINKLKLYHRINGAIPLVNPEVAEQWKTRMRLQRFPAYIASIYATDMYTLLEDIVGETESGNFASAAWMVKAAFLPALIASMLASVGETHPSRKWQYKLLTRNAAALGEADVQQVLDIASGRTTFEGRELVAQLRAIVDPIMDKLLRRDKAVFRMTHWFNQTVNHASSPVMSVAANQNP